MRVRLNALLDALLTAEYEFREAQVNGGTSTYNYEKAMRERYEEAIIALRDAINNTCCRGKNTCGTFN